MQKLQLRDIAWIAHWIGNDVQLSINLFTRHTGWPGDPYALALKLKTDSAN